MMVLRKRDAEGKYVLRTVLVLDDIWVAVAKEEAGRLVTAIVGFSEQHPSASIFTIRLWSKKLEVDIHIPDSVGDEEEATYLESLKRELVAACMPQ